jgi:hypothetical protein
MRGERRGERGNSIVELSDAMMDWALLLAAAAMSGIALYLAIRGARLGWSWALAVLAVAPESVLPAAKGTAGCAREGRVGSRHCFRG